MAIATISFQSTQGKYVDSRNTYGSELKSFATICVEKYQLLHDFANRESSTDESLKVIRSIVVPSLNGSSLFINQSSNEPLTPPLFSSFITDDHSSFEYSLSFTSNEVKVRLLFEVLPVEISGKKNAITINELQKASSETYLTILQYLNTTTNERIEIDFEKLKDLFINTNSHLQTVDEQNPFAVWFAIDFNNLYPLFKIYFNLIAFYNKSSKLRPAEAVRSGLNMMGVDDHASESLLNLMQKLNSRASFIFFAIDVNNFTKINRCKVYVRFHDISITELETIASIASNYQKGTITSFIRHFLPNCLGFNCPSSSNSSSTLGPIITFVFNSLNIGSPDSLKFHLPIRHYISTDRDIARLIRDYLQKNRLFYPNEEQTYEQLIGNYKMSSHNRTGCQTYVAFSSSKSLYPKEFTVYLSPQLYSSGIEMLTCSCPLETTSHEISSTSYKQTTVRNSSSSEIQTQEDFRSANVSMESTNLAPTYVNHSIRFLTQISISKRRQLLESVAYNLFSFPAKYVLCDFLSDSGTGAVTSNQLSAMALNDEAYGRNNGYYCLLDGLRDVFERGNHPRFAINLFTQINTNSTEIFSFLSENRRGGFVNSGTYQLSNPNTFIVPQGRCAELLLFSTLKFVIEKKKTRHLNSSENKLFIPSNGLFDTTEAHIKTNGFIPVNFFSSKLNEPFHPKHHLRLNPFKGDIDTQQLERMIKKYPQCIPLVVLTITNNTAAGQPVSLSNIRLVSSICKASNIPLMIDACRFAENAAFIKRYESGYSHKTIRQIVAEIFSHADVITLSFKKDGICNIGGVLMFKDSGLFDRLYGISRTESIGNLIKERQILYFGNDSYGGLSGREIMCCAVGIQQVVDENYLNNRLSQTASLANQLIENNIPVVLPTGGHAVYLDMKSFFGSLYVEEKFQGLGFCVELLIRFGIRTFDSGAFSYCWDLKSDEERRSMLHWVRLAIPRNMYNQEHFNYTVKAITYLFEHKSLIPDMTIQRGKHSTLRHFVAELKPVYHKSPDDA